VPSPPAPGTEAVAALVARLEASARARLGHGLGLFHLAAGGCDGCELELRATLGVLVDLERHGLRFVSSPLHADVLLVSGPVTRNLREALERTWEAMPAPKFLVGLGDCAGDGGVFRGSYAVLGGVEAVLPVDLIVRGCPPAPGGILEGLRALLEANRGA
jgi:Ni,Fe-hydrogenase III small subunit